MIVANVIDVIATGAIDVGTVLAETLECANQLKAQAVLWRRLRLEQQRRRRRRQRRRRRPRGGSPGTRCPGEWWSLLFRATPCRLGERAAFSSGHLALAAYPRPAASTSWSGWSSGGGGFGGNGGGAQQRSSGAAATRRAARRDC